MSSPLAKRPIESRRYVRNGRLPDARFAAALSGDTNSLARYRLKELARFATPIPEIPESGSGTRVRWRFAGHLSPHATAVIFMPLLATATTAPTTAHYAQLTLTDGSSTLGTARVSFGGSGGGGNLPNQWASGKAFVMSGPGAIAQLAGNTAVFGEISEVEGARLIGCTVFEVMYQTPEPVDEGYALYTPIEDASRQEITASLRTAWKQQAAPLITWSVDEDGAARVTTSTTAKNVVDDTSTTVSSSTPGWTLDLSNASTLRRVTVPAVLKVYASAVTDAGAVYLVDSTGATVATVSVPVGAAGWQSTTLNLPASEAKYDVHYKSGTGGTTTLYAASLYAYEA